MNYKYKQVGGFLFWYLNDKFITITDNSNDRFYYFILNVTGT